MGSHVKVCVKVVGDVMIKVPAGHILILGDVFYSPKFRRNIILMSKLVSHGYEFVSHGYEFKFGPQLTIFYYETIVESLTLTNG